MHSCCKDIPHTSGHARCKGDVSVLRLTTMLPAAADETKAGFDVHFVENYDEVFKVALDYESSELPLAAAAS